MKCSLCGQDIHGSAICPYCGNAITSKGWLLAALIVEPVLIFVLLRLLGK
jgi:RNA polymerase subunit RPABC4/transcription elongation factor Spt4